MAREGWSVLYIRVRTGVHKRIAEEADKEDMTMTQWAQRHFREHFERQDRECSMPPTSTDSQPG
jgi:hypothetical protein